MANMDYPETIRICATHAKWSCGRCYGEAYSIALELFVLNARRISNIAQLFWTPIRL